MPKSKSGRKQVKIENELRTILEQFGEETIAKKEVALNKAADYLVKKLQDNTPVLTGKTVVRWIRTDKYKNVRYIGNSNERENKTHNPKYGKHIPIVNMIEFAHGGNPFVRSTFEWEKDNLCDIIKGELNK